jgi:outer membrane scaffolding protein for murein synthesis (MipA/OmpV family)
LQSDRPLFLALPFALSFVLVAGAATAQALPSFAEISPQFTLRGGIAAEPEYFGSEDYRFGPDVGFSNFRLRMGQPDPSGFGISGSFRYIPGRSSDDFPELQGLDDVEQAIELGFGVRYIAPAVEAFADLRYGVTGHDAIVGELGADAVFRPSDRFTVRVGPRVLVGSDDYAETYFGVSAAESLASGGDFAAFEAEGGALTAGVELGMTYEINESWGIDSAVTYNQFLGSAADSPIVRQGSEDSLSVRVGVTRNISFGF